MSRKDIVEICERELHAQGITKFEWTKTNGGHRRLTFWLNGKLAEIFVAYSPSDGRAALNNRSFVRRKIRQMRT